MLTQAEKRNPTTAMTLSQSPRPRLSEEPCYGPVSIKCSKICLRDPQKWLQNNNSRALRAFDRRSPRAPRGHRELQFVCLYICQFPSFIFYSTSLIGASKSPSVHLGLFVSARSAHCISVQTSIMSQLQPHPHPSPPTPSHLLHHPASNQR